MALVKDEKNNNNHITCNLKRENESKITISRYL